MSERALILAAHGSNVEPAVNLFVRRLVSRIGATGAFGTVTAAFHRGRPKLNTVLDQLSAGDVTVVPFMSSEGYFCNTVLRGRLAEHARSSSMRLRQTVPVGTHRGIPRLVERRVRRLINVHGCDARATTLAVVGHGTERHQHSRDTTLSLVEALRRSGVVAEVIPAFLDDVPLVETLLDHCTYRALLTVPFFMTAGPHATRDIPARLGLAPHKDAAAPLCGRVNGRFVIIDEPVGTYPELVDIVLDLARGAP